MQRWTKSAWVGALLSASAVGGAPGEARAHAEAACVAAAFQAGQMTTTSISAQIVEMQSSIVLALQAVSGEVTGTLRGMGAVQAGIADAQNVANTQRDIQSDRVQAANAFQFSPTLCQAASLTTAGVAATVTVGQDRVSAGAKGVASSAGTGKGGAGTASAATEFTERRSTYCDGKDPACNGANGSRPNGDRSAGEVAARLTHNTAADQAQAHDVIKNLTVPVPVPPMAQPDVVSTPEGAWRYLLRGSEETRLNLATDVLTEILESRRRPKIANTEYNEIARSVGLPEAAGEVSVADMEYMRWSGRFQGTGYSEALAAKEGAVLEREAALLLGELLQQGHRTNQLLEAIASAVASGEANEAYRTLLQLQTRPADTQVR